MKHIFAGIIQKVLSIFGRPNPASTSSTEIIEMEALGLVTRCTYIEEQLICNVNAVQTWANGTVIRVLFVVNCDSGRMTVKDPIVYMDGLGDCQLEGFLDCWDAKDGIERSFIGMMREEFETLQLLCD